MTNLKTGALLALLFFMCTAVSVAAPAGGDAERIRVCVIDGIPGVTVTLDGRYKMTDATTGTLIQEGGSLYRVKVFAKPEGLLFDKKPLGIFKIRIVPKRDATIYIDRFRFRGYVDIVGTKDSKIKVINTLDIEHYLKGVLYHEISHRWPYAAMKAQAIAARTYAQYQKQVMCDKEYDLRSDVYSQVYGGRRAEKYRTNKAVDLTRGKVLTYNGEIFPAYYHATCGGVTEDASNLWKTDLPALKGVVCEFCERSKHYNWKRKLRFKDIERALIKAGFKKAEGITSIRIGSRHKSHRIKNLIIFGSSGPMSISGKDFRLALGPSVLKSNDYTIEVSRETVIFKGFGWGHGVGMCQWGAYFMARKGYSVEEILQHYYPGTEMR